MADACVCGAPFDAYCRIMPLHHHCCIRYQKVDYTAQLTPEEVITVEKAETEPTLHDLIDGWLTRTPGLDTDWHVSHC